MIHKDVTNKKIFGIISENKSLLKYTFLLDTPILKVSSLRGSINKEEFVEKCFEQTNEICLYSGIQPSLPYFNKAETAQRTKDDFSSFDKHNEFWHFIFKQHAIISAYEKTRKIISSLNEATIAALNLRNLKYRNLGNNINSKQTFGMNYLLYKNINNNMKPFATFTDTCDFIISEDDNDNNNDTYKIAHLNTTQTAKTLYDNISKANVKALCDTFSPYNDFHDLTSLNNLEFFNCTVGNKGTQPTRKLGNIYNKKTKFNKTTYDGYRASYDLIQDRLNMTLVSPLNSTDRQYNFTLADKIHAKQLIEEVFCFDIIDCLYQNIEACDDKDFLIQYLPLVSMCYNLPNTYSRHYILQMAIDNIKYNYMNDTNPDGRLVIRMTEFSDDTNKTLQKLIWLDKYTRMIKSLCKITLPVYESHFFNTMWESLLAKTKDPYSTLKEMFNILSTYLNNKINAKKLLSLDENITVFCPDLSNSITAFSRNNCADYSLYENCIDEFLKYAKTSTPSLFLNPKDVTSLNKDTGKIIRRTYLDLASNIV
ncbi:MAG: hypothetical protein ACI4LO_08065 [Anaerovoracaceae bacterium]